MAKFRELRREQRVVARVVQKHGVFFIFGRKANGENIFLKRNRISVYQIAAHEWADEANGFNQL